MKSIKSLIQELNILRNTWEFKSLSLVDEHIAALEDRVNNIEKRNMRYFCRAYSSAVQAIPNGVLTAINFEKTEHPQFGNMHDNTVQPSRIYIRRNGVYYISTGTHLSLSAAGTYREISISLIRGGVVSTLAGQSSPPLGAAGAFLHLHTSTIYYLYIGDIISTTVIHNVAAGLDTVPEYPHSPYLAVSERMEDLDPSQYGLLNPEANTR